MSWSHQRVVRFAGPRAAYSGSSHKGQGLKSFREEIHRQAREYALETKGQKHRIRVQQAIERKAKRVEQKQWLAQVNRAQRLQDRENNARAFLMKRGLQRGSDFSAGERQELRKWFDMLDMDAGGDIDVSELAGPLLSTGIAQSLPEVQKIIDNNASDGGGIDFESFQRMLKVDHREDSSTETTQKDDNSGVEAMKKLRRHVDASQSNTGLQLDSRINAHRRSILLRELTDLKNETKLANSKYAMTESGRRELAARAQRKEDRLLSLFRVVIGSKESNVAGFFQGKLPSLNQLDREKIYSKWSKQLPSLSADSDTIRKPWEDVKHWMDRSCNRRGPYLEADEDNRLQSSDGFRESQRVDERNALRTHDGYASKQATTTKKSRGRSESDPKLQLQRSLSKFLRPTRADLARIRSYKKRQKAKLATFRISSSVPNLPSIHLLNVPLPRKHPPFSIAVDERSKKPTFRHVLNES